MRNSPPRAYLLLRQSLNETGAAGRPNVPPLRRTTDLSEGRREGQAPPLQNSRNIPTIYVGEPLGAPAPMLCIQEVTLIRPLRGTFPLSGGRLREHQHTHWERWLGKARRGCETAATLIFANPGPSGPGEIAEATQILRAGNDTMTTNSASPVKGVRGKANVGTKCPP